MHDASLKLTLIRDDDGTGKLLATAAAGPFSGSGGAYVSIEDVEQFARAIVKFPLPSQPRPSLVGGFWMSDTSGELKSEHLGIEVYSVDRRGHIGVQVRIADGIWDGGRPEAQRRVQLEILTDYEPLGRFGRQVLSLAQGSTTEAVLEGESVG